MSSSSFPLLRLPLVALREIIEKIELYEQFKLSRCSKRTRFVVKNHRDKSTVSLKLFNVGRNVKVSLLKKRDNVIFKVNADAEGDPYNWNLSEQFQRTKLLVGNLCDLFAAKVEEVKVYDDRTGMLDIVEEVQGAFSYDAEIWNKYEYTDEQLRHILVDLNPRSLEIYHNASAQFRIESFRKKYENLTIFIASWMTVDNLYQLDCVELMIYNRNFSSTKINRYLKHVLRGGAPRLRKFRAGVRLANEDGIFDGIRELMTGSELIEDEERTWHLDGKVAREEGLDLVSVRCSRFGVVYLEIKDA